MLSPGLRVWGRGAWGASRAAPMPLCSVESHVEQAEGDSACSRWCLGLLGIVVKGGIIIAIGLSLLFIQDRV